MLDGNWLAVAGEIMGSPMPQEALGAIELTVTGSEYVVHVGGRIDRGTVVLYADREPKAMDITGVVGPNAGRTIPAIYELSADELRVCYAMDSLARPETFATTAERPLFLATYNRRQP